MSRLLLILLPLAIVAGGWFLKQKSADETAAVVSQDTLPPAITNSSTKLSPEVDNVQVVQEEPAPTTPVTTSNQHIDNPADIGLSPLSDDEYARLQQQLHTDSSLLSAVIDEYRNNTNPQRALQLTALLSEHNSPQVTDVAAELAYSGDPESQKIGLDLLSRLQPNNSRARDIAIDLLTTETNPELLVSTLNVLATPARRATDAQHTALLENITLLASHENANVRSHSVSLIGRWNRDTGMDVIANALNDQHPQVRARAASALHGVTAPTPEIINGLLSIAQNTSEQKITRQAALFALKDMPLTALEQQRYRLAQTSVRTRQQSN